jgi:hypothetical protein
VSAIVAGDIVIRFSTTAGSAGDTTANTTVSTFLGKYAATSAWAGGGTNDLFADISGAENAASQVDYAGLLLLNNNASNAYENAVVYLSSEVAGGASVAVAADSTASSAKGSASAQMLTIASRTTAPAGPLSFSSPTTAGTGVSLGTIAVANVKGFWVRRTAANSAALSADGVTLGFSGDTGSL